MNASWRLAWPGVVLTLAVLSIVKVCGIVDYSVGIDGRYYLAMADAPFANTPMVRSSPYCWRVLPSLLVHATGVPGNLGFTILTFATIACTPIALAWLLSGLRVSPASQRGVALLFATTGPIVGHLGLDSVRVDGPAFFLLTTACAALVNRRDVCFLVCVVLLACTKETVVLSVVFALSWTAMEADGRRFGVAVVGALIAAFILLTLHLGLPSMVSAEYLTAIKSLYWPLSVRTIARRLLLATGSTWSVVLPLAALQVVDPPRVWRSAAFGLPLVLAVGQITFVLMTERVVVTAFPFVLAATALEIDFLIGDRDRLKTAWWVGLAIAQVPWLLSFGHLATSLGLRTMNVALVLLAVALLMVRWTALRARASRNCKAGVQAESLPKTR